MLNSKEDALNGSLNSRCKTLLKSLEWDNSRVKNGIPKKWTDKWMDGFIKSNIRKDIQDLVKEIERYKNF